MRWWRRIRDRQGAADDARQVREATVDLHRAERQLRAAQDLGDRINEVHDQLAEAFAKALRGAK